MNRPPATIEDVTQILRAASSRREKIGALDISALNRVLEYTPEDLTVTAQAGIALAALQNKLAQHRQWLPIDPPHREKLSIRGLIDKNLSGPRRFGCGTIRDHLIGITVALADGTIIHSGGKVVKNVAGYDLMKLFIGAHGSLGIVLEATFKLRPLPEMEAFVQARCDSLEKADTLIEKIMQSELTPVVINLAFADLGKGKGGGFAIVLGFAGTREDVEWQLMEAGALGFNETGSLEHETEFWNDTAPVQRISVLPSKMIEAVRGLDAPFIARAGNGVVYHRGAARKHTGELPLELMRRVKVAYDPNQILPDMPT